MKHLWKHLCGGIRNIMVSVIIPYNIDRGYLQYAMSSIWEQTYRNFEIILEKGDYTLGKNVNNALWKSRGDLIKVLAEDDELTSDCLKILVKGIEGYDFIYSDAENFGTLPPGWGKQSYDETVTLESMLEGNGIHGGTTLYRREALFNVGGYDETLTTGEEYDLHLKLIKAGYKHRHISGIVYRYRIHISNKSISATSAERKARHEYINQIRKRYV